uniref:F-box domain-containing protein n=1 Tax=Macrostomum lignano TaxID=282301 RepID=A0A1I8J8D8_9PLAT
MPEADVEDPEPVQQQQTKLFNQSIPEELEARILNLLDLKSLIRCRLLSQKWKSSVDRLYGRWGAVARVMGFANPESDSESGERLGLPKLLKMLHGDWWFQCSLCPVEAEADINPCFCSTTSSKKLCLQFLLVTAFDRRNSYLHKWRLRLPEYPVTWTQVGKASETQIGWLVCVAVSDRVSATEDSSSSSSTRESTHHSPNENEAKNKKPDRTWLPPGNWVAIVPLEKRRSGPAVPLCLLPLPSKEAIVGLEAYKCDTSSCDLVHLLILTETFVLLYSLPIEAIKADQFENPVFLNGPDSTVGINNGSQLSRQNRSAQSIIGAFGMYEVTKTSNFVPAVDRYFAVLGGSKESWQSDDTVPRCFTFISLMRSRCQTLEQMSQVQLGNGQIGEFLLTSTTEKAVITDFRRNGIIANYGGQWLDKGLTVTDKSELQPLLAIIWKYGFDLMISWTTSPQKQTSLCSVARVVSDLRDNCRGFKKISPNHDFISRSLLATLLNDV